MGGEERGGSGGTGAKDAGKYWASLAILRKTLIPPTGRKDCAAVGASTWRRKTWSLYCQQRKRKRQEKGRQEETKSERRKEGINSKTKR